MSRKPRTDGKPRRSIRKKRETLHPAVTLKPADSVDGRGHPEIIIDEAALFEAARTHASYEQLGRIFDVGAQTIYAKYKDLIEKARAMRKKELLAAQFSTAIDDRNPTMQIWLGKQYLDQKDTQRIEQTGPDGKPIESTTTHRVVAVFPENHRDPRPKKALKGEVSGTYSVAPET